MYNLRFNKITTLKVLLCTLLFSSNLSYALSISEIKRIDEQIKQLSNQSDFGVSQIGNLVAQLNTAEAKNQSDRKIVGANLTQLDKNLAALLNSKSGLSNYVFDKALYSDVINEMMSLASSTDNRAFTHKSINLNLLLAGPRKTTETFFINYLNSEDIGGLRLRETLMFFTIHPSISIKERARFFASEKSHPIFRGPASWVYGKLSAQDDPQAIEQLSSALKQSVIDNYGFDTQLLTTLGLAEVSSINTFKTKTSNIKLDNNYKEIAERYIAFKRAQNSEKNTLIKDTFHLMTRYEKDEALIYILQNNKSELLKPLGLIFDTKQGVQLLPEFEQLSQIYGYRVTGSVDNPSISIK